MANLEQSPESQRIETCGEYSVRTLNALNLDCLLTIFQHVPLLDLLRLRRQCRSLNDAVCQFLQNSCHKLELNLDADRTGDDLERVIEQYNLQNRCYYSFIRNVGDDPPEIRSITFSDTVRLHSHIFKNQPHFQSGNLILVNSVEGLTDRKIDSLIDFLTVRMPNLRSLALLVSHEDYFRSVARLLSSLRKLRVFLIDASFSIEAGYDRSKYPATEIVEAICGLPELESLYYFRNVACLRIFCYDSEEDSRTLKPPIIDPHQLESGLNFLEALLPRLRVLHCHNFAFPVGMTFDKVEEISIDEHILNSVTKNYFPGVKTLYIDDFNNFYSPLGDRHLSFVNIKVLKIDDCFPSHSQRSFQINSQNMRALNNLPNLVELHCSHVFKISYKNRVAPPNRDVIERNNTIVRLYSQHQPTRCFECPPHYKELDSPFSRYCTEPAKMDKYVKKCKKYFQRLQLLTNEYPPLVRHFPREIADYNLNNLN